MKITPSMVQAARRAEYDFYQKGRALGSGRFIPTPDAVIRTMLEAAVGSPATSATPSSARKKAPEAQEAVPARVEPPSRKVTIVEARKPKPRR